MAVGDAAVVLLVICLAAWLSWWAINSFRKSRRHAPLPTAVSAIVGAVFEEQLPEGVPAISVHGLSLSARRTKILDKVSFDVAAGGFTAIVGPSGSGKSMIVEAIAGRRLPDYGRISIFGHDAFKDRQKVNRWIGFVPQSAEIDVRQSVWDNMTASAIKWGVDDSEQKISEALRQVGLLSRKDLKARALSGGQLKLLSIAMELIRNPPLLLLDEPTTGLDPNTRTQINAVLSELSSSNGKTVVFTTHFMDELEDCDSVIIVRDGKIVAHDSPNALKRRMPGNGRIVSVTLERISEEIINKIKRLPGVIQLVCEGRTLKIITENPSAVAFGQQIEALGLSVEETAVEKASMKEAFVYYTGRQPEE